MIYLASDHAGYELKEVIKVFLKEKNIKYKDLGPKEYKETDDYPDYIIPTAKKVAQNPENKGIILGGSGQGEAIVANRFPHVRAIVYYGKSTPVVEDESGILARSRAHNDANVLSLGARYFTEEDMMEIVNFWLNAPYSGDERHIRRLKKIDNIKID